MDLEVECVPLNCLENHNEGDIVGCSDMACNDVEEIECEGNSGGIQRDDENMELNADKVKSLDFASEEDAYNWYEQYARVNGFGIRKDSVNTNESGERVWRRFVCCSQGFRAEKYVKKHDRKREHKRVTRSGCKARFIVYLDKETRRWHVSQFVDDHSHPLLGIKLTAMMRSHRKLRAADVAQLNSMRSCGIKTPNIYGLFVGQSGGYENVGFTSKDIYNHIQMERRKVDGDAIATLSYLKGLEYSDPMFYVSYTIDKEGRLEHLFWCDGISRLDFECFGDVLAFDTTYRRNKYNKPLVIFSGVNHHKQTVIFGSALVSDEREETYVWLLEKLMDAMNGKKPSSVVTDGDLAMRNAIKKTFPECHHRLCAWHLLRNATSNVGDPNFTSELKKCMLGDLEVEEFEEMWTTMVRTFGLANNKWVNEMYEKKGLWATAYLRGKFFAGLRTTSRCEGMHAHVGKFIESRYNLVEFFYHFQRGLSFFRNNETIEDFNSTYGEPVLQSSIRQLEKSASLIYTKAAFNVFRHQLSNIGANKVLDFKERIDTRIYTIGKYCKENSKWTVFFNFFKMKLKCTCGRMGAFGLPCSHMIAVMMYEDMQEIPESCVRTRWTKNAKDIQKIVASTNIDKERIALFRYGSLLQTCRHLCNLASKSIEDFSIAQDNLVKMSADLEEKQGSAAKIHNVKPTRLVRDPSRVRTKGRSRCGLKESMSKKPRHCKRCNGTGHTSRTCQMSTQIDCTNDVFREPVECMDQETQESGNNQIYVPLKDNDQWYLMIVNIKSRKVECVDPDPKIDRRDIRHGYVKVVASLLEDILQDQNNSESGMLKPYKLSSYSISNPRGTPKQTSIEESGMWVAEHMCNASAWVEYTAEWITIEHYVRMRLAIELVQCEYNSMRNELTLMAQQHWQKAQKLQTKMLS